MEDWQSWLSVAVSAVVAVLIRSSFAEKARRDKKDEEHSAKISTLEQEVAVLQKTAVTAKEVREIIREENKTLHDKMDKVDEHIVKLTEAITSIQIGIARDLYHNTNTKSDCK